jgi:peptide chain release factor 1
MSILRARLYDMERAKRDQKQGDARRSQVGSAERSEKIRTYNYPQARITDHRIEKSVFGPRMTALLDGDLDEFIDELATRDEAERLQAAGLS